MNNRVQVFRRDGSFAQEFFVAWETRLNGAIADLVTSRGEKQRFLFTGHEQRRARAAAEQREVLSTFRRMGCYAGQFMVLHNVAIDSQGSLYISEVDTGQHVQRFVRTDQNR